LFIEAEPCTSMLIHSGTDEIGVASTASALWVAARGPVADVDGASLRGGVQTQSAVKDTAPPIVPRMDLAPDFLCNILMSDKPPTINAQTPVHDTCHA
jgi:hypothetical protein